MIRRYDVLLASERRHPMLDPDSYLEELTRRETERQGRRLEVLTWVIAALTVMLVALELVPRIMGAGH